MPAIWQGFAGSVFMMVGSYGVGWINLSSPFARFPPVIILRTEDWGVSLSVALLALGGMLLVRSWLRLGQRLSLWGAGALKSVLVAIALWSAPLVFALPIYSRDVYAYNAQGRLALEGFNPYETGIAAINNWFQLGVDPMWSKTLTPYGPVFVWLERSVAFVAGDSTEMAVFLFRLLALVGVVITVCYTLLLSQQQGVDGGRALWIALANPLTIISFAASAHNDSLMIGFALAALYYAHCVRRLPRGKHRWIFGAASVFCIAISIGVKPITVAVLPFVGLAWVGTRASYLQKIRAWAASGFSVAFLLLLESAISGLGWQWLIASFEQSDGYVTYSPAAILSTAAAGLFSIVGADFGSVQSFFLQVLKWAGVGVALWFMLTRRTRSVLESCGLALAAIVMFNPIIQHWYVLWFIPFLAAAGMKNNWQLKAWYVMVIFFVVFGAQDQLNVWRFVETPVDPASIVIWVAFLFLLYVLVVDPKTRWVLLQPLPITPVETAVGPRHKPIGIQK